MSEQDFHAVLQRYEVLTRERLRQMADHINAIGELLALDRVRLAADMAREFARLKAEPMAEEVATPTREPCVNGSLERE